MTLLLRLRRHLPAALLLALALPLGVQGQTPAMDPDRRSAVDRGATPALAPAPEEVPGGIPHPAHRFGFHPGDDYQLADLEQLEAYYAELAEASPRVQRIEIGRTFRGNAMHLLFISSEENLAQLDRWREISERLARGHGVDEDEARRMADEGRALVWIDNGLHSTEVAHAQHGPLLAWHMATDESEETRRIRDDVILLLVPQMNPDGHEVVVNWYRQNLGTDWETTGPPEVYHEYVGHDINRDWFMFRQAESQAVARQLYETWYPQIVLNHHQTAPFPARIFIPPFADPLNPHIPPLVVRGVNMVGEHMAKRLEERNMPGAVSRMSFTMWWNGGMRTTPYFHNMVGILTEVGHASATPQWHDPERLPQAFGSGSHRISAREPSVFYANPWEGGWATLADAVAYHFETSMAALDLGSRLREDWLFNKWRLATAQIEAGEAGGPFAYLVDLSTQRDAGEAVELLNVLRRGGVEIHRATAPFRARSADGSERSYPEGTYVALAAQAYRAHLMDLLEPHEHPNREQYPGGPPEPPYGGLAGWTISMAMGVDVHRIDTPFQASLTEVAGRVSVPAPRFHAPDGAEVARLPADAWGWVLPASRNDTRLAVNRLLALGAELYRTDAAHPFHGVEAGPGAFVVRRAAPVGAGEMEALAAELGLQVGSLAQAPNPASGRWERLAPPRLGLYMPWTANMDEGWTRYILREFEFPVDTLRNAGVQGDLSGYHALLFADQGAGSILNGPPAGSRPPEVSGGVGEEGVANLRRWVEGGGTVIGFDGASDFLIRALDLPVENAVQGIPNAEFFIPGSLLRTRFEPTHPVALGMAGEQAAFFQSSRGFNVSDPERAQVVARYAEEDLLMSGWELGGHAHLAGRAAVVRVAVGEGEAILIGFRPQFRAQPTGTYKLFFNAIHGAAAEPVPDGAFP